MTTEVIILWISGIVLGSLAGVMLANIRTVISRAYTYLVGIFALWMVSMGVFYFVSDPKLLTFFFATTDFLAIASSVQFYYFCTTVRNNGKTAPGLFSLLISFDAVIALLFAFTNILDTRVVYYSLPTEMARISLLKAPSPLIYVLIFCFISMGVWQVFRTIIETSDKKYREQLLYFVVEAAASILPAFVFALVLPLYFDLPQFYWLTPITATPWVFVTTRILSRLYNMRLRILLAKIAIVSMSGILFLYGVLGAYSSTPLITTIIFGAFSLVGIFFVANLVRNEEQREELERITKELTNFNNTLEAKVAERTEEIENARTHADTVVDNLASGICEIDGEMKIIRFNKTSENIFGISKEEILYTKLPRTSPPKKLQALSNIIYVYGETIPGESSKHVVSIEYPSKIDVEVTEIPMPQKSGAVFLFRDITREQMIARAKSEFISVVAHQLRTPLSVVKWTISTLLSGDTGTITEKQKETLENAYSTNARMVDLVNDLLDVARIEDGKFGFEFGLHEITKTAADLATEYEQAAKEKGVLFSFIPSATAIKPFYFDEQRLSLAIRSVLDNSMRYTPKEGTVVFAISENGGIVEISVKDNGIGVPESQMPKLFTKFFRADNATKMSTEGSGLGLFIAKNIVEKHGGSTEITSKEGYGTSVLIKIPISTEKPSE